MRSRIERNNYSAQKLNIGKVLIVVILLVLIIIAIIFGIKYIKKSNLESKKEELQSSVETEESTKTIEEVFDEFGGTLKEKVKADTYYVEKDGKEYTLYADGEIVEGRVVMWDGTSQKPAIDEAGNVNIYNPAEFRWIAEQVASGEKSFSGVTINLRNSLDFGARKNEDGVWEGNKWTPIIGFLENSEQVDVPEEDEELEVIKENLKRFAGTFIGNDCSIRGLYVDTDAKYSGLFGYNTGVITNLNIKNSAITGTESVGALVGLNEGTIKNCIAKDVEVIGAEKVGGIVGTTMTSSVIEECKTEGNNSIVIGDKYVGGLVGYVNNNSNILKVSNNAKVSGSDYIGGIAGISFFGTTISNSNNTSSKVVGVNYVGGLIGYSQAQIENSYSSNNSCITGKNYVGGLVGANYVMGNIQNCFNNSKIILSENNGGGIVGINNANITNCYNTGEISAEETEGNKIGGICGQNISESYINTSYNIGKISSKGEAGGAVGVDFGTVSNCFYLNNVVNKKTSDDSSKSEEEMKTGILETLGESYKQDSENINSGFPILSWQ